MSLELEKYAVAPGTPPANILAVYAREDGGLLRLFIKGPDGGEVALGITLPVPIASGGTGATTAAAARSALGAAASGANSDITSIAALSTPLSIPQGGTGQASAAPAYGALSPLTTKGDLQGRSATAPDRLPVGSNGQVLTADSAEALGMKWAAAGAGSEFDPKAQLLIYDDFFSGTEDTDEIGNYCWRNYFAGTGNNFSRLAGEAGHPGIVRLQPGTVETARQCITLGDPGAAPIIKGGGEIVCEAVVRLTQASPALFESVAFGLGDVVNAVGGQANGIYFQYIGGASPDTNWHLVTANGGVRTRRDTGIPYASGGWIRLRFTINAAGTSIQANVNGADVGAAITTNIPTIALSLLFKADAITGGATTNYDVDYVYLKQTFTTAR